MLAIAHLNEMISWIFNLRLCMVSYWSDRRSRLILQLDRCFANMSNRVVFFYMLSRNESSRIVKNVYVIISLVRDLLSSCVMEMRKRHKMKKKLPIALSLLVLLCMLFFSCPVKRSLFSSFLPNQYTGIEQSVSSVSNLTFASCSDCNFVHEEMKGMMVSSEQLILPFSGFVHTSFLNFYTQSIVRLIANKLSVKKLKKSGPPLFIQNQSFLI